MSRTFKKLLLIIIILSLMWGIIFLNFFFNKAYKGGVEVSHNARDWQITVKAIWRDYELKSDCYSKCYFPEIIPWDYIVEVTAAGYDKAKKNVRINDNETSRVVLELDKITTVKLFEEKTEENKKVFLLNKRSLQDALYNRIIWSKVLYLKEKGTEMYFWIITWDYSKWIELLSWDIINPYIDRVYMTSSEYFVNASSPRKYIVDVKNSKYYTFNFKETINYLKKISNNEYLLVSDFWVFKYDVRENKFEHMDVFDDFVYYEWGYLWYIKTWSKYADKYGIDWKYLLKYNIETKKVEKITSYTWSIERIELILWEVYLTDSKWDKYTIKDLK